MVVSAATNYAAANEPVMSWLATHRKAHAVRRRPHRRRRADGELAPGTDIQALGDYYAAVLHGLSVQARDGVEQGQAARPDRTRPRAAGRGLALGRQHCQLVMGWRADPTGASCPSARRRATATGADLGLVLVIQRHVRLRGAQFLQMPFGLFFRHPAAAAASRPCSPACGSAASPAHCTTSRRPAPCHTALRSIPVVPARYRLTSIALRHPCLLPLEACRACAAAREPRRDMGRWYSAVQAPPLQDAPALQFLTEGNPLVPTFSGRIAKPDRRR